MKKITLSLLALSFASSASFAETALQFSPAPITSTVMSGESVSRYTGTYLNVDIGGGSDDLTGYGFAGTTRSGGESGASATAYNLFLLTSDDLTGISANVYFGGEKYIGGDSSLIAFAGPTLGYNFFTIDSADVDTLGISAGLQGGIQKRIGMGSGYYFVPYAIVGWTFSYNSTSTATDTTTSDFSYTSSTLGFDFTLPGNYSLATALSSGESDVFMISFGAEF